MTHEVEDVLREEKEEKVLGQAEMQVRKGENLMLHDEEIRSRPKRTWFESERDKQLAKVSGRVELNGPAEGKGGKRKVGRLSHKDKKRLDDGRERREGKVWKKGKEERDGGGKLGGGRGGGGAGPKRGDRGGSAMRGGSKRGGGGSRGSGGGGGGRGRGGKGGRQ